MIRKFLFAIFLTTAIFGLTTFAQKTVVNNAKAKTMLLNSLRGLCAEYGFIVPKGYG